MRYLAVVALAACGSVNGKVTPDASTADAADMSQPTTYHAMLDHTDAVPFGGTPYCNYTITLEQLDVAIAIQASGRVSSATVQDLNVEGTLMMCPYPPSPPSIANYSLESSKPVSGGTELTFKGAAANAPAVALTAVLQPTGSIYSAHLGFMRTDQVSTLNWSVAVTLTLAPQ